MTPGRFCTPEVHLGVPPIDNRWAVHANFCDPRDGPQPYVAALCGPLTSKRGAPRADRHVKCYYRITRTRPYLPEECNSLCETESDLESDACDVRPLHEGCGNARDTMAALSGLTCFIATTKNERSVETRSGNDRARRG